jgi:hypothetical protein
MPTVSIFYGISIRMYYREHEPPHFHAHYAGDDGVIQIDPLAVLSGSLPPRVQGLVLEWAALHQAELREDWALARKGEPLKSIAPLG